MTEVIVPLRKIKILHEGFNMSMIIHPKNKFEYLATIRQKNKLSDTDYPTIENKVLLLKLDSSFQVLESDELVESIKRDKYVSFTTGIEDCRLIDGNLMTGVCMDTNPDWVSDMCLCNINIENKTIERITVFTSQEEKRTSQKNWLVLHHTFTTMFMLHSYDPLRVMSVHIESGSSNVIRFQKIFNLENCDVHGGASIYLEREKLFLVNIRIVQNHKYEYSMWMILNDQYRFCGISKPFLFANRDDENNSDYYEMCMSLVKKRDVLYASVSFCDKEVFVYEFLVDKILKQVNHINHV